MQLVEFHNAKDSEIYSKEGFNDKEMDSGQDTTNLLASENVFPANFYLTLLVIFKLFVFFIEW